MINKNLLLSEMQKQGYSQRSFCEKYEFNLNTFNRKLNGLSKFDTEDIVKICDALGIDSCEKKCDIFLSSVYSNMGQ